MNLQNDWVVAIGSYSLYDLYTKTLSIRKKRFGSVLYLTFQRYCGKSEDGYRIMENKKGRCDYNRREIGGVIREIRVEYAIEIVRYFNSCVANS